MTREEPAAFTEKCEVVLKTKYYYIYEKSGRFYVWFSWEKYPSMSCLSLDTAKHNADMMVSMTKDIRMGKKLNKFGETE